MERIYIYGLLDPRNYELRYIGKTNSIEARLRQHLYDARNGAKNHKCDWIRLLLSKDLKPIICILEEVTKENWQEVEKRFIADAKENGLRLTNFLEGGQGFTTDNHPLKGKRLSEEHKRKISKGGKGLKRSSETRQRISKSKIGNKNGVGHVVSEKHKEILRRVNTGKLPSEETRQKLREANLGRKNSKKTRQKISEANMGHATSGETRRKIAASVKESWKKRVDISGENNPFYGKTHSPETIQKIKETKARNKARAKKSLDQEKG